MPRLNARTYSSLIYFEACGRLLSFSAAAKELHITTGAVSQQIRKLEDQLGFKLFLRHPVGIGLTEKGEDLLKVTGQSIDAIGAAIDRLQQPSRTGIVLLRSTPSFAFKWLIPKLKEFNSCHPEIKVETYAEASLLDLNETNFDLAIDYSPGNYSNVDASLLVDEQLLPVVSPDYMPKADWNDPDIWTQIALLHDAAPWQDAPQDAEWRYWLDQYGLVKTTSDQGHYFNRSDMAIAAADAGLGVALARRSLVEEELKSGRLIAPLPALPSCCNYYLLTPKGPTPEQDVSALIDWLINRAQQS